MSDCVKPWVSRIAEFALGISVAALMLNRPGIPGGFGLPLGLWSRGAGFLHATMVGWWVSNSIGLSMPSEL